MRQLPMFAEGFPMIPDDRQAGMTPEGRKSEDDEIRRRQKSRALVMGVLLGLFVILVFAITLAKMSVNR